MPTEFPIIELRATNIKRLRAVRIRPDRSIVKISGENGQGKTSTIDSISMLFGGKGAIPAEPLRRGAREGEIVAETPTLIFRRTFSEDGRTALEVTNREGVKQSGPQTLCDSLIGNGLAFDPSRFAKMPAKDQGETLRKLAGLDFADIDGRRAKAYADRTLLNRQHDTAKARLRAMTAPEAGLPEKPLVLADLVTERQKRATTLQAHATRQEDLRRSRSDLAAVEGEIRALEESLKTKRERAKSLAAHVDAELRKTEKLVAPNVAELDEQIRTAEATNAKVRNRDDYLKAEEEANTHGRKSDELSEQIKAIDEEKAGLIAGAKMPIPGLGFDADGGVTLNGFPLDQASQAERLKVSMSIALAQNPALKVVLIRDGNDLDRANLALLAQMADAAGAMVFIERVEDADGTGWVIEDGMVKSAPEPIAADPAPSEEKPKRRKTVAAK